MGRQMYRVLFLTGLLATLGGDVVRAQQTNTEILGRLAVECLGEVPGDVAAFRLHSGERMPYLRPFLTRFWLSKGYKVIVGDSLDTQPTDPLHKLSYDPMSATVTYDRVKGDSLLRSVGLSLSHSFVSPQGVLLSEAHCRDSSADMVAEDRVNLIQADPWEETRGDIPLDRGWRTWAEPVAIGSSIGAIVYLFFSVRS